MERGRDPRRNPCYSMRRIHGTAKELRVNRLHKAIAAIVLGLCAYPGAAIHPAAAQGIEAIDTGIFKSADINNDGKISRREIIHFADLVFLSTDANGDDVEIGRAHV